MSHANISIFVPHNGCPHECSFCNQRGITGQSRQPNSQDVVSAIEVSLNNTKHKKIHKRELAFFGGSFTAIDKEYMIMLLEAVSPYIKSGQIQGIRVSTRPDAIDNDILNLLKYYGVTAIELGAQSMIDSVLEKNNRGHSSDDVRDASKLIKDSGFELGLQMMVGLYGSNYEGDLYTCDEFIRLKPETVRIYPTVIMKGTKLAKVYCDGQYIPMDFESTVNLCAVLLDKFETNEINVIRLGLHSSESLKRDIIVGVWHPAFREICESKRFLSKFIDKIEELSFKSKDVLVRINDKDVSKFIGQKKCNLRKINDMGYNIKLVCDEKMDKCNIEVEELF